MPRLDIIKVIKSSILLAILVLISLRFYIEIQPLKVFNVNFNGIAPLIFLSFLASSYLRKNAAFLGWLLGGILLVLLLGIFDIVFILFVSIFLGLSGYVYSYVSKNKIKTFTDVIRNIIGVLVALWIISGITATIYEMKTMMTFDQAYNTFFTSGIIIVLVINIPLMYFYSDKIRSVFNKI